MSCGVNTESRELADSQNGVSQSHMPVSGSSDPAMSSQNASEFDFNEFFRIDSVSITTVCCLLLSVAECRVPGPAAVSTV